MPHRQPHWPLQYNYRSHKPLATVFWLMDRPWWFYVLAVCAFVVKHSPTILMPLVLRYAINGLSASPPVYVFGEWWFLAIIIAFLLQNIPVNSLYWEFLIRAVVRLQWRLRSAIMRRLQQLSIAFHDEAETGRLQAKLLRDVDAVEQLVWSVCQPILSAGATLVMAVSITAAKDPKMMAFFIVTIPITVVMQKLFKKPIRRRSEEFRRAVEEMSARASQMIEMIPITRAHAVEGQEISAMDRHLENVSHRGARLHRTNALFNAVLWVSLQIPQLICVGFVAWMCYEDTVNGVADGIRVGDVVMYSFFFQMILGSAQTLLAMIPGLARGSDAVRSIGEVLECPDIEENEGKEPVTQVDGRLTYVDVTFHYPKSETPAVLDFSIDITPGECIAFVGESGGGKTTLMSLAVGFHRPTSGEILLDGVDMETLDLRTYRKFLAVVPQRTILLAGTIRNNILYGLEGVSDHRLREVIEAANVAEFTDRLPDGLESMIGERGAKLSGGQQQRIAVARALIRDPRIIILDEATSALDVISEALVQEAVNRLVADRTTLIVAHRLSTVRKADRIVVMKGGQCVELDTPQKLLEVGGEFAKLHSLQQMLL